MSEATFASLDLSDPTSKGVAETKFLYMTEVQVRRLAVLFPAFLKVKLLALHGCYKAYTSMAAWGYSNHQRAGARNQQGHATAIQVPW